ncbi:MAG: hypothetical protein ACLTSK_00165 [Christensenellales bacterium]
MNFVVYKTNTLKAAKNRIEELLKAVSRSDIDSPHIVIVPDRASLAAERSMLAAVGGSFNIQVFTFNRYAGLIAPETLKPLSGKMAVLEMMKVIEQNADRLVCFSGAGNTEGFARKIYDVISLLKYNRISPEKLLCACDDKALSLKLKDIALVYSAFQASVENRYLDSADKLETLLNAVGSSEQVKKSVYYIYDFDGLSVQEEAIVESLVRYSRGVYAACAAGAGYMYSNGFYASLTALPPKRAGAGNKRQEDGRSLSAREKALLSARWISRACRAKVYDCQRGGRRGGGFFSCVLHRRLREKGRQIPRRKGCGKRRGRVPQRDKTVFFPFRHSVLSRREIQSRQSRVVSFRFGLFQNEARRYEAGLRFARRQKHFSARRKRTFFFSRIFVSNTISVTIFPASIWAGTSLRRRGRQPSA